MASYVGAALDEIGREMKKKRSKPSEYTGWNTMPGQPRDCMYCGKAIRISRESCGFKTFPPLESWHWSCRVEERKRLTDG